MKGDVVPIFPLKLGSWYDRFARMPRGPRLDMEGALHHVIARELEARDFLLSDTNRQDLAKRMTEIATQTLNCGDVIDYVE